MNPISIELIVKPDRSVVLDPLERAAKTVAIYRMIALIAHCAGDSIRNGNRAAALKCLWGGRSGYPLSGEDMQKEKSPHLDR